MLNSVDVKGHRGEDADLGHHVISIWPEKSLTPAKCATCGKPGFAYTDTKNPKNEKSHYCIEHNPLIKGGKKN